MAVPVPEKQRAPPPQGSKWGPRGHPWAPAGGGERAAAAGGPGLRSPGSGVLRTWQSQAPAGPEPGWGAPARRGPARRSSRRRPGTHLPSQPRRHRLSVKRAHSCTAQSLGIGGPRPASSPWQPNQERGTPRVWVGLGGLCRPGAGPGELGAGPGGVRSDLTAARRKPSRPRYGGSAAGQRGRGDHAGHRQEFPPASGRLRVGGR